MTLAFWRLHPSWFFLLACLACNDEEVEESPAAPDGGVRIVLELDAAVVARAAPAPLQPAEDGTLAPAIVSAQLELTDHALTRLQNPSVIGLAEMIASTHRALSRGLPASAYVPPRPEARATRRFSHHVAPITARMTKASLRTPEATFLDAQMSMQRATAAAIDELLDSVDDATRALLISLRDHAVLHRQIAEHLQTALRDEGLLDG